MAEFPLIEHPELRDPTEIWTLLPDEPPKDSNVGCVTVVSRWCESMNVVSNVLPFHKICDWGVKPLPSTISGTEFASRGTLLGESEIIWGCSAAP